MALFKTITQGGQVHIHQLHMLKQILVAGVIVAFVVGFSYFSWTSYHLPGYGWRVLSQTSWAKFMLATTPPEQHPKLYQDYIPPKIDSRGSKSYRRSCISILKDPLLKKITRHMEARLEQTAYTSLWVALLGFLSVMVLWFFMGRVQRQTQHQRGTTLVPWKTLRRLIMEQNENSDLNLVLENKNQESGKLPLIKNKETSHILITGTTGSGKTNAFHILLPQIRQREDRAIILDVTGDYISRYYDEERDILLNPLDKRSHLWHPWADCHLDSHYDVLAETLIQPKEGNHDPFWDKASRALLKTALRKYAYQKKENIGELATFLMSSSNKEFEDFFKGTEAATFASSNNEKTTHSIRSVLSSQLEGLHLLESSEASQGDSSEKDLSSPSSTELTPSKEEAEAVFSIRKWIMGDPPSLFHSSGREGSSWGPDLSGTAPRIKNLGGWLFITARADQRQSLTPLMSTWMDIAINALMVLPENYTRRFWFVLDELAALQKLPSLQRGLAEGRKYGGCFLAGFQSKPQLEEIYGRSAAETMLDLFNTKIFFRCTEPSTQSWMSKVLGDKEESEPQENISYGAHNMRDGVSLSRHTRQKPLILPTELSQLKDLECYIKLPGDYPCTKIQMPYQSPHLKNIPFLLKPEKKREYPTYAQEEISQEEKEY